MIQIVCGGNVVVFTAYYYIAEGLQKREEYNQMSRCIAGMGSVTQAMKAQNALSQMSIHSQIVKLDSSMTRRGCSYGVEFPCCQRNNAKMVIEASGMRYEEYIL